MLMLFLGGVGKPPRPRKCCENLRKIKVFSSGLPVPGLDCGQGLAIGPQWPGPGLAPSLHVCVDRRMAVLVTFLRMFLHLSRPCPENGNILLSHITGVQSSSATLFRICSLCWRISSKSWSTTKNSGELPCKRTKRFNSNRFYKTRW